MTLVEFFWIFLKASLFSTDGFGNLPSLHQDLLANGAATDADFARAIAVGQLSPGPNGLWVVALGYFINGWLGAVLSLAAVITPPFLVLGLAAVHSRVEQRLWVQGLLRGVSLAVVGTFMVVIVSLLNGAGVDWRNLIFMLGAFGLARIKRVGILVILGLAALGGLALYGI